MIKVVYMLIDSIGTRMRSVSSDHKKHVDMPFLKFAYNVFDRRTTARHTQEAASHHVNALYSLPSEHDGRVSLVHEALKTILNPQNFFHSIYFQC